MAYANEDDATPGEARADRLELESGTRRRSLESDDLKGPSGSGPATAEDSMPLVTTEPEKPAVYNSGGQNPPVQGPETISIGAVSNPSSHRPLETTELLSGLPKKDLDPEEGSGREEFESTVERIRSFAISFMPEDYVPREAGSKHKEDLGQIADTTHP